MNVFLSTISSDIIMNFAFGIPKACSEYIQKNRPIEKRFLAAFKRAVRKFYSDPERCGSESIKKYDDYLSALKDGFETEKSLKDSVQYPALLSLFELEVFHDPFLRIWLEWNNRRYLKGKIDLISQQEAKILDKADSILETGLRNGEKLDTILAQLQSDNSDNSVILAILPEVESSIQELRIIHAHRLLGKIRAELVKKSTADYDMLCRVDYLMAICSSYNDAQMAIKEYCLAYEEMEKAGLQEKCIMDGRIKASLMNKDKKTAMEIREKMLSLRYSSHWMNSVSVLFSESPIGSFNGLQKDSQDWAIANLLMIGCNVSLDEFYNTESIIHPVLPDISYESLPIWVLYLNILLSGFYRYDGYDLFGKREASPRVVEIYSISSKLISFIRGTDLEKLLPDLGFIHSYMGYEINKTKEWLDKFKECIISSKNDGLRVIFHFSMLIGLNMDKEAKQLLINYDSAKDQSCLIEVCKCIVAIRTDDIEIAVSAYEILASTSRPILHSEIYYPLICLVNWSDELGRYVDNLVFANPDDKCLFFSLRDIRNGGKNIEWLKQKQQSYESHIRCLIAEVYKSIGFIKEGRSLLKSDVNPTERLLANDTYLSIIGEKSDYAIEEYSLLKQLRINKVSNLQQLNREYFLAMSCHDYDDALCAVSDILSIRPNDTRVYTSYLVTLSDMNNSQQVEKELPKILSTEFSEEEICNIHGVLVRSHFEKEALELLFQAVYKYETQQLKDLYIQACYSTTINAFINTDLPIVERDSYISFVVNSEDLPHRALISENPEYFAFVGCHLNEKLNINLWGKICSVTIIGIRNKYYKLHSDLLREIAENKSNNSVIKVFSSDDLFVNDDPISVLMEMAGVTVDNRNCQERNQAEYERGQTSLIVLLNQHDISAELVNKLFGHFVIINYSPEFYLQLLRQSRIDLKTQRFILDYSSVLLLYELNRRFSVKLPSRPIIPKGLREEIINQKVLQECNLPSSLEQDVVSLLDLTLGRIPLATRLTEIIDWIDKNCDIIIAEKTLLLHLPQNDESFFNIEKESLVLLEQPDSFLITEDWGLLKMLPNFKIINTAAVFTELCPDKASIVLAFLKECNFVFVDTGLIHNQ